MAKMHPKILLLGDSLTQLSFEGWGATIANVYQRRCDVLNRGYSGYNSRFYLELLPSILDEVDNVALIIVWFGANDAALQDVDPHHHVPLKEYNANLSDIVQQIRTRHPAASILLISPPPVHHGQRLEYQRQRYGDRATGVLERKIDTTSLYAEQCGQVAQNLRVPFLDIFHSMQEQDDDDWARFLCDGLHLSPAGHDFVASQILLAISTHNPDLAVIADPVTGQFCNSGSCCRGLSPQGPYHDQIDANNVKKAFESL